MSSAMMGPGQADPGGDLVFGELLHVVLPVGADGTGYAYPAGWLWDEPLAAAHRAVTVPGWGLAV